MTGWKCFVRRMPWIVAGMCIAVPGEMALEAQSRSGLTVDHIMQGAALVGHTPGTVRWSRDSQRVYFEWKQASDPLDADRDTYVVGRDGSGLRKLSEEDAKHAAPVGGDLSTDKSRTVFADAGDLFLYDHSAASRRRLTRTREPESNPRFTTDDGRVTFLRGGNLYALALDSGSLEQLTDIYSSDAKVLPPCTSAEDERERSESQAFLEAEERNLIDYVDRLTAKREEDRARCQSENPRQPHTLESGESVADAMLSPDGRQVIARLERRDDTAIRTVVPNYVTDSAYTADIDARLKVGDPIGAALLLILDVETGETRTVDHGQTEPAAGDVEGEDTTVERPVALSMPVWSADGTNVALSARSLDNKDMWVMALDPDQGSTRVLSAMHDEAWVGPWRFSSASRIAWGPNGTYLYYLSEQDGFAHLYRVGIDGGEPEALTAGDWKVHEAPLSDAEDRFYLTTSEVGPEETHLYSMALDGGERVRLTQAAGRHDGEVSPDGTMIATVSSYANRPPELFVQANRPGAEPTRVTESPTLAFGDYAWTDPPIVRVPARDGIGVPARIYKPANYQAGGPAVIFVHGAGYTQNVHKGWSSYYREFMFHHLLMERGYLVLDLDYRASAGYGRNWRTAIYRHMGGQDLEDQVDAARWLVREHGVGEERIGIYGGSYGGFITLMAMFTQPGVFAAGAALRPVTDWAHYNDSYTSNILNRPQDDPEAYRRSSPIYFAEGLEGALLICHGMVDTNVHFQDSVRLAQRLIELRKENWEMAVYPVENHGFVEPTSWADEYKRILKLFEGNLN